MRDIMLRNICLYPADSSLWLQSSQKLSQLGDIHHAYIHAERAAILDVLVLPHCALAGYYALEIGRNSIAYNWLSRAICINPDLYSIYQNMGVVFDLAGSFKYALSFAKRAMLINPDIGATYFNISKAYLGMGDIDAAINYCERAIIKGLMETNIMRTLSLTYLVSGQFHRGWKFYERRFFADNNDTDNPQHLTTTKQPLSNLTQVRGRSVLVWAEQGVGDEIMFGSMLREVHATAGKLIVQLDKRLIPLFQRSLPPDTVFFERYSPVPEDFYDYHVAIGSLGKHLRSDVTSFTGKAGPYLRPDPRRVSEIRTLMSIDPQERIVGLSWRSSHPETGPVRSINLLRLIQKFKAPKVRFVNLQYGDVTDEILEVERELGVKVWQCPDLNTTDDIDGLAALIESTDLVVTIGNTTAHLTGALGKKGIVLLPKINARAITGRIMMHWRWLGGANNCLWYDSLRLERWESHESDWSGLIDRLNFDDF